MSYVVEVKEHSHLYGMFGPFRTKADATEWSMQHVEMDPDLNWEVLSLHSPEEGIDA